MPLSQLVRAQDRLTFLYLEHCVVHRDANAITARDAKGVVHIPAATLGALLLGPGTNVSQQAMLLLAERGSTAVWVGEHGVRYYAHGRSLAHSSRLLEAQAALVSNQRSRLRVARQMYDMRFPDEDTSTLTMQQLRGREGARVRRLYRLHAQRTGISWDRRDYDPTDFAGGTPVNQALSAANTSLYGVVHAVIVALGCALDSGSSTPATSSRSSTTSPTSTKPTSASPSPSTSPPARSPTSAPKPAEQYATTCVTARSSRPAYATSAPCYAKTTSSSSTDRKPSTTSTWCDSGTQTDAP